MKDVLKHCYHSDFAIFLSLPTSFIFWCIVAAGVILLLFWLWLLVLRLPLSSQRYPKNYIPNLECQLVPGQERKIMLPTFCVTDSPNFSQTDISVIEINNVLRIGVSLYIIVYCGNADAHNDCMMIYFSKVCNRFVFSCD